MIWPFRRRFRTPSPQAHRPTPSTLTRDLRDSQGQIQDTLDQLRNTVASAGGAPDPVHHAPAHPSHHSPSHSPSPLHDSSIHTTHHHDSGSYSSGSDSSSGSDGGSFGSD